MTLFITLFLAGLLTILLPCILPLIPIVLGVSIAGRSKLRPLLTIAGMLVSFVGFTFLLLIVLGRFIELADYIRIATYFILLLFGFGFLTGNRGIQWMGAVGGSFFFLSKGPVAVIVAALLGLLAMELGGRVAARIQQLGVDVQQKARSEFGEGSPLTAFIIGLTLGLVWVPCAGPALGFAFTLVREEPGIRAALALGSYGLGTAVPLLAIGYGGQAAVHSVRTLSRYSSRIKQIAGALLILSAIGLQFRLFEKFQIFLLDHTNFGDLGTRIEERLFERDMFETMKEEAPSPTPSPNPSMNLPILPKLSRAPEFSGLGPWHNSEAFTLESVRGKVVLVDFWTYSCINCIRTLPYIQGYWEKFKDTGKFVLLGVHSPEFAFEKLEKNVADAIERHRLTYPVAQDNNFETWRAFANRYWPAKYLIDADGYIRYTHFGEGAYEETDLAIQSLLAEIGVRMEESGETDLSAVAPEGAKVEEPEETKERRGGQSPETYLGERSWLALGNAQGDPNDAVISYQAPSELALHKYYLVGKWQLMDGERQVLRSDEGEIRMKFLGGEINLVLGLESDVMLSPSTELGVNSAQRHGELVEPRSTITADIEVDGEHVKSFEINKDDLFNLFTGAYGEHEVILRLHGAGVAGYAFTFGS